MKRVKSRLLALLLVTAMVLSMAGTALATETESTSEESGYTVTFETDDHATIDVYYNKDTYETDASAEPDETNATSAVAREKGGTAVDTSGEGQVNFRINVEDGYEIAANEATPTDNYKNYKGSDETGVEGIYRITKITGDVTVTVTTQAVSTEEDDSSSTDDGDSNDSDSDSTDDGSSDDSNGDSTDDSTDDSNSDSTDDSSDTDEETALEGQSGIALAVGVDETERRITWYFTADGTGTLTLAKESELVDGEMPADATTYEATGTSANKDGYYYYQVTMSNLEESTTYAYQLTNGNVVSGIYTFEIGADDGSFTFALAGDPQIGTGNTTTDTEGWCNTLDLVSTSSIFEGIEFLLSVGDQVDAAADEDQYDGFLSHSSLTSLSLATVIGNHDTGSAAYSEHFNTTSSETNEESYGSTTAGSDYYYVYEGVLFLVLNSNNTSTAEHQAFMEAAIEEAEASYDISWKVVTFHHSIYSVASHSMEDSIISRRNALVPIFEELGIDVVLMGHDHVYARTYIMDGLEVSEDEDYEYDEDGVPVSVTNTDGTLYITANSASGSKYYNIKTDQNFEYAAVMNQDYTPNISLVTVTENSFTVTTYETSAMSQIDTFTIYREDETTDDDTTDDGTTDDGTTDDGNTDDSTTDNGTADDSTTDNGTTNDSTTDDEATDNNSTDDSSADNSSTDNSSSDNSTTDNGSTDNSSTDNSSTDNSSTDNSSTDSSSTDTGSADSGTTGSTSGSTSGSTTGTISVSKATVTLSKSTYTYNGKAKTPSVTVRINGTTLKKGTDYTVSYSNNTNAGTATVTIKGKGNYTGSTKETFTIKKATQKLTIKKAAKTVKYTKVKKAKQTVKAISKVSGAKGTVTYTKVSVNKSKYSKYFTVNKKAGKITVKKGTPKGTYKITIKVKATATKNYKASAAKKVTVTIKVK